MNMLLLYNTLNDDVISVILEYIPINVLSLCTQEYWIQNYKKKLTKKKLNQSYYRFLLRNDFYIIFDDYGLNVHENHVKRAVDENIDIGYIEVVKKIGCEPGHTFGENRILKDHEGLICKVVK